MTDDSTRIDNAGDEVAETRIVVPVPQPATDAVIVPVVVDHSVTETPAVSEVPNFDGLRCSTCREIKKDDQLMKQPLEAIKNPDGSISIVRYSVFCGTCQQFLCIYDPKARKEIDDMIKNRNESTRRANGGV